MNRSHLALGLVVAVGGFVGGWAARGASQVEHEPTGVTTDPDVTDTTRTRPRAPGTRALDQTPTAAGNCPRFEYEELLELNSQLQQELGRCQADKIAWPEELPEAWSAEEFQKTAVGMLTELGHRGDIEFHCDEFPCIAKFSGDTDLHQLEELAAQEFGAPEVAHVDVRVHGIVGPFGRHRLGFIAAGPTDQIDDFAKERVDERVAALIQSTTSELKRGSDTTSR